MKTTTVRMDEHLLLRVDGVAKAQSRSRSWIINQALERFIAYEEWYQNEVENGLAEVTQNELASEEQVQTTFEKWGVSAR
ncbi:MAG: ribbon-helix-helix protein, CopG family [Geopsychrobacter sp.]|nr:ribbon-helix-helix protein, CopG family [Geopsychrobacter sp.]